MAVTTTTRLGITRWSSPSDPFNRTQLDDSHAALEAKAALFLDGLIAARPAAGASNAKGFYYATDSQILYFSTGSSWVQIGSFGTPVVLTPGLANFAGAAVTAARSDHVHGMLAWGTSGEVSQVGTSASAGVLDKYSHIDHVHVLASNSVTAGKIAPGGVSGSGQIADGIIVATHFAPGAIDEGAINPSQRTPIGSILAYGGVGVPTGWLMCDGTTYNQSSYPGLFAIIGLRYSAASMPNPGTNFQVPDLRTRIPRGASAVNNANLLGVQDGADTATLAITNIPIHQHTIDHDHAPVLSDPVGDHSHTIGHDHGAGVSGAGSAHTHGNGGGSSGNASGILLNTSGVSGSTWSLALGTGNLGALGATFFPTLTAEASHTHTVSVPAYPGNLRSGLDGGHNHLVNLPNYAGLSGQIGSGTGFDIKPKTTTVNFIIKI